MAEPKRKQDYPAAAESEGLPERRWRDHLRSTGEATDVAEPREEIVKLETVVRHDPTVRIYTLNEFELDRLESEPGSIWRPLFLAAASLCMATSLNAISGLTSQPLEPTVSLLLNTFFGTASLLASLILGFAWRQAARSRGALFERIRTKEKLRLSSTALRRPITGSSQQESLPEQSLLPLDP